MESSTPKDGKQKYQKQYFRVTITYSDDETSGRVFTNRDKAEKYAAKQKKSPVVKKTKVEAFIKDRRGTTEVWESSAVHVFAVRKPWKVATRGLRYSVEGSAGGVEAEERIAG